MIGFIKTAIALVTTLTTLFVAINELKRVYDSAKRKTDLEIDSEDEEATNKVAQAARLSRSRKRTNQAQ